MTTLNISLPDNLREWIAERVKKGDYSSASDYLRDLIRGDQRKIVDIDALLLSGIDSGKSVEVNSDFWAKKHNNLKHLVIKAK